MGYSLGVIQIGILDPESFSNKEYKTFFDFWIAEKVVDVHEIFGTGRPWDKEQFTRF